MASSQQLTDSRWQRAILPVAAATLLLGFTLARNLVTPESADTGEALTQSFADESRCIECHEQAESFHETGHAQTLRAVTQADSLKLLQQLAKERSDNVELKFDSEHVTAIATQSGESQVELNWCFGSGHHARTWTGTLTDSWGQTDMLEFRWTWYNSTGKFDLTPGQSERAAPGYFEHLGVLFDQPKTRRCFECHTTHVDFPGGGLDTTTMRPGVTCQACHGPRQAHVESEGELTIPVWQSDREDAVNRCAVCHRRASDMEPAEIKPDNPDIARFQPVGLVQSACFRRSPSMTCTTCHDPHKPMSAQDSAGIWQCLQCHSEESSRDVNEQASGCAAGHVDGCLQCHMPKVPLNRSVSFTDHWIRVRSSNEENP